jgi:hypothetical protein
MNEQASEIASYVLINCDDVDKIIVHCEAGVSRSAGAGAIIMKYLNRNDWDVFDQPRFRPDMICYRKVLGAFYTINKSHILSQADHVLPLIRCWYSVND